MPALPSGTSDILARLIGPELTRILGQPVVVENRAVLIYAPYVLAVANKVPTRDAADLRDYAMANAGRLNAGNSGVGSSSHRARHARRGMGNGDNARALARRRAGAPARLAVTTGETDITIQGATQALSYATSGQMRAIAVTGSHRLAAPPAVPIFGKLGRDPRAEGPASFRRWLDAETAAFTNVIRCNNIRADKRQEQHA